MRTAAVLPIKSFSRAKSRLGGGIDRSELAAAMAEDVLSALAATPGLADVIVVTAEPVAEDAGAVVVNDPEERGQSAAAERGIEAATGRGAERVLLVPGDCPALDPREVGNLLESRADPPQVVIVPDRHGSGTNALLLAPPDAVAPSFGAGSLARHAAHARAAGAAVKVRDVPSLGLDVDTADDLAALRAALDARPSLARRTREVLERLVPAGAA
ncbi:MAG TPA: 2-phospho-L-lactate guanylyltransferase [Solirubrobacteraceae bacterium]|nr:2-phospho-L-lactate guanylyltransferase [Solirubrobacteraceae bacterium]